MRSVLRPAAKPLALELSRLFAGAFAAAAVLGAAPAAALQFDLPNGIRANVDTTVSYGISVRADERDPALIGIANGGTSRSVNEDDGNLNFESSKPFANILKATVDAEVKWRNFGFFGRGSAYYDFDLHDSDKLGPVGRKRLGKDVVGLDGFVYGAFDLGGRNLNVRLGRQVISWGESTFIANGINVINAVDLSKLRVPGSELKEAFIPTTGIWASFQVTNAATLEGFYLTNHDKIRLDPRGSYFSNNDFASDDANRVILSFGRRRDEHSPPTNPVPPNIPTLGPTAAALYGPVRSGRLGLGAAHRRPRPERRRAVRPRAALSRQRAEQHRVRPVLHELPQPHPALLRDQGHADLAPDRRPADHADLRHGGAARALPHRHRERFRRVSRGHPPLRRELQHRRPRRDRAAGRVFLSPEPAAAVRDAGSAARRPGTAEPHHRLHADSRSAHRRHRGGADPGWLVHAGLEAREGEPAAGHGHQVLAFGDGRGAGGRRRRGGRQLVPQPRQRREVQRAGDLPARDGLRRGALERLLDAALRQLSSPSSPGATASSAASSTPTRSPAATSRRASPSRTT